MSSPVSAPISTPVAAPVIAPERVYVPEPEPAPEPVLEPEPELVMAHAAVAEPVRPRFMSEEEEPEEHFAASEPEQAVAMHADEPEPQSNFDTHFDTSFDAHFAEHEPVAVAPKFAEMAEPPAYDYAAAMEERRPLPTGALFAEEGDSERDSERDLEVPTFMRRSKLFKAADGWILAREKLAQNGEMFNNKTNACQFLRAPISKRAGPCITGDKARFLSIFRAAKNWHGCIVLRSLPNCTNF